VSLGAVFSGPFATGSPGVLLLLATTPPGRGGHREITRGVRRLESLQVTELLSDTVPHATLCSAACLSSQAAATPWSLTGGEPEPELSWVFPQRSKRVIRAIFHAEESRRRDGSWQTSTERGKTAGARARRKARAAADALQRKWTERRHAHAHTHAPPRPTCHSNQQVFQGLLG
jgi:hypothetical protein